MQDGHQPEVEQEVISKYEQEPEFRNFIKNLLRCRSLASLDENKEAKRGEEEKTARTEKKSDDIERRVVGGGRAQDRRRRTGLAWLTQETSGRGEPGDGGVSSSVVLAIPCQLPHSLLWASLGLSLLCRTFFVFSEILWRQHCRRSQP